MPLVVPIVGLWFLIEDALTSSALKGMPPAWLLGWHFAITALVLLALWVQFEDEAPPKEQERPLDAMKHARRR